jgi:hypothetical protein
MPRRKPKGGTHTYQRRRGVDGSRGRHKGAASPEAARWEADHLIPERPAWMEPGTYVALAELRNGL